MVGKSDGGQTPNDDPFGEIGAIDEVQTIGERLAALDRLRHTAARGTGQARVPLRDLAVSAGVPLSSLSHYLRGTTLLPSDALDALVLALGVAPADARRWADA
ncbi:helix-turn-helix domain-containing protein [Hamadaea tsunoensis]|uniref:helix-turn-helix domain-containing protein n=1 Tax=Hamadaea tsunoensis TaxID=53368 RepID=UPI0004107593|nr:helix-turn-helix transcriptional regulator [Hamadaea tsunoensis]